MSAEVMSGYALTPLAKSEIFNIWPYIAERTEDAATKRRAGYL